MRVNFVTKITKFKLFSLNQSQAQEQDRQPKWFSTWEASYMLVILPHVFLLKKFPMKTISATKLYTFTFLKTMC